MMIESIKRNDRLFSFLIPLTGFILLMPFLILCIYNYPSIDDYYFTYKTNGLGFWKAQQSWFTEWTGRYFSTFVLSLHPLLLQSFFLYQIISFVIIILTVYSVYRLFRLFILDENKLLALGFSFVITFCFFDNMPYLAEGIYWLPGATTYQLANIMLLVFIVNNIKAYREEKSKVSINILNVFLIIAINGSNETAMVLVNLAVFCFLAISIAKNRKHLSRNILYAAFSLLSTLIVFAAPGNAIRKLDYKNHVTHDWLFTINSTTESVKFYLSEWFFSSSVYLSALLLMVFYFFGYNRIIYANRKQYLLTGFLFALLGILILFLINAIGYWTTGKPLPERTMNIACWIFIICWSLFVVQITRFVLTFFKTEYFTRIKYRFILPVSVILLLELIATNVFGNFRLAVEDLFSGKAHSYANEYLQRESLIKACSNDTCEVMSFVNYPRSVFVSDLSYEVNSWKNFTYAAYHSKPFCILAHSSPKSSKEFIFSFEDNNNDLLINKESITNELSYSKPNSSRAKGLDANSAIFRIPFQGITRNRINAVFKMDVSFKYYCNDTAAKPSVVCSITDDKTGEAIYWVSKVLKGTSDEWRSEYFVAEPENKMQLRKNYFLTVYIWNRGEGEAYVDDWKISFY